MTPAPLVVRATDAEAAAERCARDLARLIGGALGRRGAAHVALSGGRTPIRVYQLLGGLVEDWRDVNLWFCDERCVAPDDPRANGRLVGEALEAPGARLHRIEAERGADAAARAYERELADVVLDAALLGIGEDGHTASLFPRHRALDAAGRVAAVHDAPKPPPERVTLTRATLDGARERLLLATGAEKARALAAALAEPTADVPASLLRRDGLTVIADEQALAGHPAGRAVV